MEENFKREQANISFKEELIWWADNLPEYKHTGPQRSSTYNVEDVETVKPTNPDEVQPVT